MKSLLRKMGLVQGGTVAALTILLGIQTWATYSNFQGGVPATVPNLDHLPSEIGGWEAMRSYALEASVADYLQPDSYVDREYAHKSQGRISLFAAYFKSLKSGYGPHSPKACLPGSGWLVKGNREISSAVPGGAIPVNEYWMVKGGTEILVRYWYQNRRHVWAPEIMAKVYLLPDMIRLGRSEIALVRVIARVNGGDIDAARSSTENFIQAAFPVIRDRLPE